MILLCRICLNEVKPHNYTNIFSVNDSNKKISEVIANVASIQVFENDNLPKGICNLCLDKLNIFYDFKNLIINSDTHLKENNVKEVKSEIKDEPNKRAFMTIKVSKVSDENIENSTKPNSIFQCDKCNKKFKFFLQMPKNNKPKINSDKIQFKCDKCGEKLTFFLQIPQEKSNFNCKKCEKSFSTKQQLNTHNKGHEKLKDKSGEIFICEICSKQFKEKRLLKRHITIHQETPKSICPVCGKMVVNIDSHIKIHSAIKKYACSICGQKFYTNSNRIRHEETHKGLKPHNCLICKKSFTKNSTLKIHLRVHTGEKPFNCRFCQQTFAYKQQKELHEKKKHKLQ